MKRLATTLLLTGFLPTLAQAQVCARVDAERDMLAPEQQRAAELLVETLLAEKGQTIARDPEECTATYRVSHAVFGYSVTVTMTGPQGIRQATVLSLDELPGLYSQMVNALLSDAQLANSNSTVTRRNVTPSLSYQPRVEADGLWYLRLGASGVSGSSVGPAFGFGYRYELDTMGVEVGFLEFSRGSTSSGNSIYRDETDVNGSWIKLMGLKYVDPLAQGTPVLGAGLSWSRSQVYTDDGRYEGGGIQLHLRGGYDLLRASTIRMFVQVEAGIPLYESKGQSTGRWNPDTMMMDEGPSDSIWTPSLTLAFGVGWVKSSY